MIQGLSGTEDAVDLLRSVATALVNIVDQRIMPSDIVAILEEQATKRGWSLVQSTYYAGANYVHSHIGLWPGVLHSAKTDGEA